MKKLVMAISVALALLLPCQTALAGEWKLDDALKQIDKATKGVKGLTGKVTVTETRDGEEAGELHGGVAVRMDGLMRFDIEGDSPKTYLCLPGRLFIHTPAVNKAVEYPTKKHPDRLSQYAIIGFEPSGSGLLKDFLVSLLEETELGSSSTLLLELTPKDEKLRGSIPKIQLWIDQASWLPLQQRIFHSGAETHLTVRYSGLSRNDGIENSLFAVKWPKGTIKEKAK